MPGIQTGNINEIGIEDVVGLTICELIPFTVEPPPSSEPRIATSISEYRGLCHTLQALTTSHSILTQQMTTLRAHQEQIITTQTQHTVILR